MCWLRKSQKRGLKLFIVGTFTETALLYIYLVTFPVSIFSLFTLTKIDCSHYNREHLKHFCQSRGSFRCKYNSFFNLNVNSTSEGKRLRLPSLISIVSSTSVET